MRYPPSIYYLAHMSGLYIHIPFCTQACHYCDFHFSTSMQHKNRMIEMMCKEIELQKDYLADKELNTIYFGGGTPSLLELNELNKILYTINHYFSISDNVEITLEANPDDLSIAKFKDLKSSGINRLSIGIQTFDDQKLKYLNRIHTSENAITSVENARKAGFENITIDLIYGIPSPDHIAWKKDLKTALDLAVPHISSYCLTIEDGTTFGNWKKKQLIKDVEEEFAAQQFEILIEQTEKAGLEQYEISNFSIPGNHSKHNSNYWLGAHYLGIGPSAHSFNGISRQYNISNNAIYIKNLTEEKIPFEKEVLGNDDIFNEALMTGLRTKWGFDIGRFEINKKVPATFNYSKLNSLEEEKLISRIDGKLYLSKKGKLIADKITLDLFV